VKPISKRILVFVRQVLVVVVAAIFIWTIIIMIFEEKFIFFPSKFPDGIYENARYIPNIQECWIRTEDGIKLHAWFAAVDTPLATLVISHGNAGNISHRSELMRRLLRTGFNVLMYDYRGYGKSEGSPDEQGVYKDGRAAFDYALTLRGVDPKRIVLWGTSLGGAVAIEVATQRPAAALILESTFSSAKDLARAIYPFLPIRFFLRSQFNSIDKIQNITIPVLSMHGNRDKVIPFGLGRKLFNAAKDPKEFYEIKGADHNDTYVIGGNEYLKQARTFIIRQVSSKRNRAS